MEMQLTFVFSPNSIAIVGRTRSVAIPSITGGGVKTSFM